MEGFDTHKPGSLSPNGDSNILILIQPRQEEACETSDSALHPSTCIIHATQACLRGMLSQQAPTAFHLPLTRGESVNLDNRLILAVLM